jgi:hypothetical protein
MRSISGPHCIYEPSWLKPGEATHWHAHGVPHHTIALAGDVLVELQHGGRIESTLLREGDSVRWALAPAGVEHRVTLLNDRSRAVCFFGGRDLLLGRVENNGHITTALPDGTEQVAIRLQPQAGNSSDPVQIEICIGGRVAASSTVPANAEPDGVEFFGPGFTLTAPHDGTPADMTVRLSGSGRWSIYWGAW